MFGWIGQFLSIIRGLMELYRAWQTFQENQRAREAAEKKKAREDAVDHSKGAESDDEIWEDQTTIIDNKP